MFIKQLIRGYFVSIEKSFQFFENSHLTIHKMYILIIEPRYIDSSLQITLSFNYLTLQVLKLYLHAIRSFYSLKKKITNHKHNFFKIFQEFFPRVYADSRGVYSNQYKHRNTEKKLTSKSFVRQFKTRILFSSDCKSVTFNQPPFIAFYRDSGLHSQGGKFDGNYHEIGWPFRACQVENFPNDWSNAIRLKDFVAAISLLSFVVVSLIPTIYVNNSNRNNWLIPRIIKEKREKKYLIKKQTNYLLIYLYRSFFDTNRLGLKTIRR